MQVRIRLTSPTMGYVKQEEDAKPKLITIPQDSIILANRELHASNADTHVEVEWEGNRVTMFTSDLRERGKVLKQQAMMAHGG